MAILRAPGSAALQLLVTTIIFLFAATATAGPPKCRCLPWSPCWPSQTAWSTLNSTVGGRLLALRPLAEPCYSAPDSPQCQQIRGGYTSPKFRGASAAALQWPNYEVNATSSCPLPSAAGGSCGQGRIAVYAVAAQSAGDVAAALSFAKQNNIKVGVKNTGHDFLGRTSGLGALWIWTQGMKGIAVGADTVTVDAGATWEEVYGKCAAAGRAVVGGNDKNVGAAGGYVLGGGHSSLSVWKGLAVDNVVDMEVVTTSGQTVKASATSNQDLFWALRGGGGGTFGVVTKVTYKTYPTPNAIFVNLNVTGNALWDFLADFHRLAPKIEDAGGSGYYFIYPGPALVFYGLFADSTNSSMVDALFAPIRQKYASAVAFAQLPPLGLYDIFSFFISDQASGKPTIIGSRLVSRDFLQSAAGPGRISGDLKQLFATDTPPQFVLGNLVAGGQVARNKNLDMALNPVWRRAASHIVITRQWDEVEMSAFAANQQDVVRQRMTADVDRMKAWEPDMGAYLNEADRCEKDAAQSFYGRNYARLRDVKRKWDPDSVLACKTCVGSEGWDDEQNCKA